MNHQSSIDYLYIYRETQPSYDLMSCRAVKCNPLPDVASSHLWIPIMGMWISKIHWYPARDIRKQMAKWGIRMPPQLAFPDNLRKCIYKPRFRLARLAGWRHASTQPECHEWGGDRRDQVKALELGQDALGSELPAARVRLSGLPFSGGRRKAQCPGQTPPMGHTWSLPWEATALGGWCSLLAAEISTQRSWAICIN